MSGLLLSDESELNGINFIGLARCPMRRSFKERLETILQTSNENLRCYIPSGCRHLDNVEAALNTNDFAKFPDIYTSSEFSTSFKTSIRNNFINKGLFKAPNFDSINRDFSYIDCIDPAGEYFIYAAFPVIIAADRKTLGNLPLPETFENLLNPIYKNNITLYGVETDVIEEQLLYFYKNFGIDGIKTLAKNVKNIWHPAKISKTIGTGSTEGTGIYILPWFFAKSCPNQTDLAVIWPKDGALLSPLTALIKESKYKALKSIIDLLTSYEFGTECANNHFPSLNPMVKNNLPEEAKFQWLGWDFIRTNDIEQLSINLNNEFVKYLKF